MVMDRAHIIALNRFTGAVIWDTVMADWKQNYNATSAPLIVGDLECEFLMVHACPQCAKNLCNGA